jgi:hypothetical protein
MRWREKLFLSSRRFGAILRAYRAPEAVPRMGEAAPGAALAPLTSTDPGPWAARSWTTLAARAAPLTPSDPFPTPLLMHSPQRRPLLVRIALAGC